MDRKIFLLMLPQELIWRGNIGRIDAQEFGAAETRRNHDRRDADPQRPVQPAGRLDPHGLVPLRV